VVKGLADSFDWTDETERQFQIAEESSCRAVQPYLANGFAAVLDHCRNLPRLDKMVEEWLPDERVAKVLLLPSLEVCLDRARRRTTKDFDPLLLEPTINYVHRACVEANKEGWIVVDSTDLTPEETGRQILGQTRLR
jgi:hypothetical protein